MTAVSGTDALGQPDPSRSRAYAFDHANRLTASAVGPAGAPTSASAYAYDASGARAN